ncbi:MAG: endonuclease MutS2 [Anaerolineae bacterium]|nr:endonuclease MutS2 [Anaerolineae bacterium]
MAAKHWRTLELPKILERLATYTSFSAGAEKAHQLTPSFLLAEVREGLETTSEARALLDARPHTSLGGARDVRDQVEAARRGVTLPATELLDVRDTLLAARTLQQTLARMERQFPRLADIAWRIAPCDELIEHIGRCLDERAEVRDDASADLARIRREMHIAHDRLMERLQRTISSSRNAPFLQEAIITLREGRYVIPLKADFKGRIRGVVHDRSASGATLFIEPFGVVDLNNAWRELQIQEEQEIHRLLAEMSGHVAARGAEIVHTVDALADLDLAFARARYAEEIDAVAPTLPDSSDAPPSGRPSLQFLQARHPLLDPKAVVPIDVVFDEGTHVLVITGPNTGGKTVSLKTVGLLTLMAQAGLHVPAAAGSALVPFVAVYADIGDEQSIEQSLSTFSSHLTNILSFIELVDENSLVLLDELGAGTDPAEGAALARVLLEDFRRRRATTLVATHYPELKAYAQLTPGVKNACVEFDAETLQPTYHLTIGLPGRSNAFAIARRLGLSEQVVRQAKDLVSQEDRQTEGLLADLHRMRLQEVRSRDEAAAARAEAARRAEELQQRLARVDEERAEILAAAREQAAAELEAVREEAHRLRQQLRTAGASLEKVVAAEEELALLEEEVAPPEPAPAPPPAPPHRPLRPGDTVWVKPLRSEGEVLLVEGREVEVQAGPARVRLGMEQFELRGEPAPDAPAESPALTYEVPAVSSRLDLRGATVEEALGQLDRHLDAASLRGLPWLHIVHGKGTGALRHAVRDFLRTHPLVSTYRPGDEGEGGEGVTVAMLAGCERE